LPHLPEIRRRTFHGCLPYSSEQRRIVIQKHLQALPIVSALRQKALDGSDVDARPLVELAREYQTLLTRDRDCVLSAPFSSDERHTGAVRCVEIGLLAMSLGSELELDESTILALGTAGLVAALGNATEQMSGLPAESVELLRQAGSIRRTPWQSRCTGSLGAAALHVASRYVQFKGRLGPARALSRVLRGRHGGELDQAVLRALLRVVSLFPLGSSVQLSDGRIGRVLRSNPDDFTCPVVQIFEDSNGSDLETQGELVDLTCSESRIVRALFD
jgi:hypothetical protein